MFDDPKEQTKESIWKFLDELSANKLIYSTHLKSFETEFFDNDIFIYTGIVHCKYLEAKAFLDVILIKDDSQFCNEKDQELYEEDNGYSDTLDKLLREDLVKNEEDNVVIIRKT